MALILHKGSSTNSGNYLSMVKVGDIWFECNDVKSLKLSLTISVRLVQFICYFTKEANLRGIGVAPMDAGS